MIEMTIYNPQNKPCPEKKKSIIDFLFTHLEEYGDPRPDIEKAIDYALKESPSFGGFIIEAKIQNQQANQKKEVKTVGVTVLNQTGMKDYIPENILVYIATAKEQRGKGIGKMLMEKNKEITEGDIALHVEPDNPARYLYEKTGFGTKYIEMRFKRGNKRG